MNDLLGRQAEDRITGFSGTITGYCEYISGCHQVLIFPSVDDKGNARDGRWFDVQRLEVSEDEPIRLDNRETPGCDMAAPTR